MRDIHLPGRSPVMGSNGMIATSHPLATQAGLDVLKSGGNAMDAAVAASAVLCVVEPQSTGIGGDCFLLYHQAKDNRLYGLNGSGAAPIGMTAEAFSKKNISQIPERGLYTVTVPGAIDAWDSALTRFGTRGLDQALKPAIHFAENGYPVTSVVGKVWKKHEALLRKTPSTVAALLVNGKAPLVGHIHRQPQLAQSLNAIATQGKDAFYKGVLAQQISSYMEEQGGWLCKESLANHQSEWVEPIHTSYRGWNLHEIPPNGQGITALMTLNILESFDIAALPALGAERVHLFNEAWRLSMAERGVYVADPRHANIPIQALLDKTFAKQQATRINTEQPLAHPIQPATNFAHPHRDTIYLSVVDKDRNACSFINSLFHPFGSGVVAGETGIMLQNRGGGFVLTEGHPNQVKPGKRPLHTIIPAMVYEEKSASPLLCYGVMGGQYQAMGHAWVLSNLRDMQMDLQQAIDASRFLPQQDTLAIERSLPNSTCAALADKGYTIQMTDAPHGGGQAIYIDSEQGVLVGASDPRKDGCALGY